jgi:hypothetical protein
MRRDWMRLAASCKLAATHPAISRSIQGVTMPQALRKPASPPAAPDARPQSGAAMPSASEIYEMVCEAAYYRAEKRGFTPGLEAEDWVQAEAEVMERMRTIRGHP